MISLDILCGILDILVALCNPWIIENIVEEGGMAKSDSGIDVMGQFEVVPWATPLGETLAFTNSSFWMLVTTSLICFLLWLGMRSKGKNRLVPTLGGVMVETVYNTVNSMMRETVGPEGRPFFPFIFSLYTFILAANLIGLVPGSFTITSHLSVNLGLSLFIFIGVTLLGIIKQRWKFLRLFFPAGAPWWSAIVLVPVELVSYFSRPISLAVRLFANMTVGHVLLKLVGGFVFALGVGGFVPLLGLVAINALEVLIALVHAYVFAVLSCVYLSDALHPH